MSLARHTRRRLAMTQKVVRHRHYILCQGIYGKPQSKSNRSVLEGFSAYMKARCVRARSNLRQVKSHACATLLCFVALLVGCASPKAASGPAVIYLYSWRTVGRDYAFVFVQRSDNERFLSGFNRHTSHIRGVAKLELELAKLSPGSGVAWRDYKTIGLTFPPESIRTKIEKAAAAHGVTVEIVPTIYD
jgi:hypothetical protein